MAKLAIVAMSRQAEDDLDRQSKGFPDIYKNNRAWPMQKPKRPSPSALLLLLHALSALAFFLLGLAVLPFVLLYFWICGVGPRVLCGLVSWIKYRHQGVRNLFSIPRIVAAMGQETYTVLYVLKGECNLKAIRDKFQALLEAKEGNSRFKYPELRRSVHPTLDAYYCDRVKENVDVKKMVRVVGQEKEVSLAELANLLQWEFKFGFIGDKPDWQVFVIPRFKYGPQTDNEDGILLHHEIEPELVPSDKERLYGIVFHANAAALPKEAALKLLFQEIADNSIERSLVQVEGGGRIFRFFKWIGIFLFAVVTLPQTLFLKMWHGSPESFGEYKRPAGKFKGEPYHLSATRNINLTAMEMARDVSGTTITSILASCIAGAARNMILSQDKKLPSHYRINVKQGQTLGGFNCNLKSESLSYPLDRLRDAFFLLDPLFVEAAKMQNAIVLGLVAIFCTQRRAQILYKWLYNVQICMEVWDFGNTASLTAFKGDRIVDVFAWNGIAGTWADYGATIVTYAGRMKACFIGDNEVLGFGDRIRKNMLPDEFLEEYTQLMYPCDVEPKLLYKNVPIDDEDDF